MKAKLLPDVEELKKMFYIDSSIPNGLRWKAPNSRAHKIRSGEPAGCSRNTHSGVRYFTKINSVGFYNSRIIYSIFNNINLTSDQIIDHIDRQPQNNHPNNLRIVNDKENSRNVSKRKNTTSKYIGVCFHKASSKFQSSIQVNKQRIRLGLFDTEKDAAIAYNNYIISHNLSHFNLNIIS
jgi:hypothetical protein